MTRVLFAVLGLVVFATPTTAAAHDLVDEGKRLLRRAEFEEALQVLEQAEAADDLTREDVVALYDARAFAHLALDDSAALRRDLAAIASLDPEHRFGREAPPELADQFTQTVQASDGVLAVRVGADPMPGAIEVTAEAVNDPASLVREIRVMVRKAGGEWRRSTGEQHAVPAGQSLEYYAEAFGPGGAVIASVGSEEQPVVSDPALAVESSSLIRRDDDDEGGGGISPWVWVGIAGGVVVAAAVVLIVILATSGQSGTQPNPPIVIGF